MRSAASSDPEIADALAEAERLRYHDAAAFVRLIARDDRDVARTDVESATDLWFALTGYEVYDLLIGVRGWPLATRALDAEAAGIDLDTNIADLVGR